ncbi:mRNA export factor mex67 [Erysiphe neolycopersici]|uniref:mRNA export factor mex67 n=1 Tax=Erysiphe neolycopersici TaxID=212602 RepID=A0A420I2D9_9PEZI|nr:mRNA export factor mex67 [Erysiphe neolycopersici]
MSTGRLNMSRGTRNSSSSARGLSRGGIKKRRNGASRVDKDGDLVMDTSTVGPRTGGNEKRRRLDRVNTQLASPIRTTGSGRLKGGSKMGNRRSQQAITRELGENHSTILETVEVTGLNSSKASSYADGGLESLLGFLERKACGLDSKSNRTVKIKKSSQVGDSVFITASKQDIEQILKLDNVIFAGVTLSIKPHDQSIKTNEEKNNDGISAEARNLKIELREFLATRYNVEHKLLDLSRLGTDPKLRSMGLYREGAKNESKLFKAIMVICDGLFKSCKDKQDAITSIALTDNSLSSLSEISSLAQTFPDIKNIDLSRNKISDLKALEAWRWKFRSLEILILKDNPIESSHPDLKTELMKRYPRLHTINNVRVRSPEEISAIIAAIELAKTPIPIAGPLFRDLDQVGETFIRYFIPNYDNDRIALATSAYDSESTFSLSINMQSPRDKNNTIPAPNWSEYLKSSRNLNKVVHNITKMNRQFTGAQSIQAIWTSLPKTKHPDIEIENNKYLFEGHELPGVPDPTGQSPMGVTGMIINMHGEFQELRRSTTDVVQLCSFSRTFVLGPGPPAGPAIRVISDLLVLRPWAPLASSTTATIPNISTQEQIIPSSIGVKTIEQQQELIAQKFMEHTGMTLQYSLLCLQQTEWDVQKANELFNQKKVAANTREIIRKANLL